MQGSQFVEDVEDVNNKAKTSKRNVSTSETSCIWHWLRTTMAIGTATGMLDVHTVVALRQPSHPG